jgi:hypothetical protein
MAMMMIRKIVKGYRKALDRWTFAANRYWRRHFQEARMVPFTLILSIAALALTQQDIEAVNRTAVVSNGEVHLNAAPGSGLAWIKSLDLNEGCLSLEVKGSNEFGRSFVGLAFRGADQATYDAVYVRPFVFQSDNPEHTANAIQYVSMPDFGWQVLRERSPGVYEKSIGSRPSPLDWVHLRVQFGGGRMKAYVNHSKDPQLDLALLTSQTAGSVALWVGNNSSGSFRNVSRCGEG